MSIKTEIYLPEGAPKEAIVSEEVLKEELISIEEGLKDTGIELLEYKFGYYLGTDYRSVHLAVMDLPLKYKNPESKIYLGDLPILDEIERIRLEDTYNPLLSQIFAGKSLHYNFVLTEPINGIHSTKLFLFLF